MFFNLILQSAVGVPLVNNHYSMLLQNVIVTVMSR